MFCRCGGFVHLELGRGIVLFAAQRPCDSGIRSGHLFQTRGGGGGAGSLQLGMCHTVNCAECVRNLF